VQIWRKLDKHLATDPAWCRGLVAFSRDHQKTPISHAPRHSGTNCPALGA
jgi:hypothetical protein